MFRFLPKNGKQIHEIKVREGWPHMVSNFRTRVDNIAWQKGQDKGDHGGH